MPNLTCKYDNEILVAYRDYVFDVRQLGRERKLLCRECDGYVYLKRGRLRAAHFAHFSKNKTTGCSSSNESQEHLECKNYLAKLLESRYSSNNVFPEHKVESGQEADVYLELPTKKIAFEIQFSLQSEEQWKNRTELYKRHGVVPVWILGFRKAIDELYDEVYSDISIPITMQNAAVELPDIRQWENYFEHSTYIRERQRNKTHVFHFFTYKDKRPELWVAYLRPTPDKKTSWHGDVFPIGSNWEFLEEDFRFAPEDENRFNLEYNERRKRQDAIESERTRRAEIISQKMSLEQKVRRELKSKLFEWLKVDHETEIPELIMQYKEHKIERIFTIRIHPDPNEIPDRLTAEIAVYYKFIKTKPIGFEFSYSKDIEPFLREWKFCSNENKQYAAAQISSGFLARLRQIGVLEKSPNNGNWKVSRKLLLDGE